MNTERDLLVDCLQRLNAIGIAYMLTGSMASNYWGVPRTTHDLDFVVQFPPESVSVLVNALSGDFFIQEASVRAAFRPPFQFNAIDNRSALKVDFWMLQNEPFEQTMFSRRRRVTLFGVAAWIATGEDVVLHKLYWNRLSPSDRQLGDAAGIVAVQSAALDIAYLHSWASRLQVGKVLDEILAGKIRPKQT